MVKILKFVYVMVLFIFLSFVATEAGGVRVECETEKECPQSPNAFYVIKCVDHFCEWYLILINNIFKLFFTIVHIECETDEDCQQSVNVFYIIKCIDHFCEWVELEF
ncbi:uncharacterized protein LOC131619362 [Vicia villosa]|uniref:uncharacterized protein LOC131619362 n=1 Tax=Vicia villosa TaxID=3911 RepID=UPI00273B01BC|nr:uncharacterized protein LOC131619362 [Vicia villosa]